MNKRPWADMGRTVGPLVEGEMTGQAWAHLATSSGLWVLLPLVAGSWWLTRREIS